jgi:hypothetical protein
LKAVYNKTGSISQESDHPATTTTKEDPASEEINSFDYFLHSHDVHETGPRHVPWCFDRLQPFESEPEPLINNPSVNRILKRNSPVVLSREYRRKSSTKRQFGSEDFGIEIFKRALLDQTNEKTRKSNWALPIITTPIFSKDDEILVDGSYLSNNNSDNSSTSDSCNNDSNRSNRPAAVTSSFLQDFDEYEQQQPSPWSQSPAPSPAIMDPEINPFFQSPPDIDDEAFNPCSPESYDNTSLPFPPPISNVHSIVHVPLFHPSDVIDNPQSIQQQQQHQHSQLSSYFTSTTFNHHDTSNTNNTKLHSPTPIAILSFLAPIVPYPPILLSSIASLSPFIAASFTNANQNDHYKKQGQFYNRRNTKVSANTTPGSNHRNQFQTEKHDTDEEEYYEHIIADSTTTTPTAAYINDDTSSNKRPDHLGSMSNFTRSSLDTVTGPILTSSPLMTPNQMQPPRPLETDMSSVSSYDTTFSSPVELYHHREEGDSSTEEDEEESRKQRKQSSQPSVSSSKERRSSYKSFSPSSVAVMEGWGAVSPTTGLPISSSIPPHTMCSQKTCTKHHTNTNEPNDSFLDTTDDGHEEETVAIATETDSSSIVLPQQRSTAHARKRQPSKRRHKKYKRRSHYHRKQQQYDDDGFHFHHPHRNNADRFLVAPKSSLLRLIIDGIPIHVL